MTGAEALANFNAARKAVADGRIEEAKAMKPKLLPSDWKVVERRIAEAEAKQASDSPLSR